MGLGEVGPVGQGGGELLSGLRLPPGLVEETAEVVMAVREDGLQGERPPVGGLRFPQFPSFFQGVAQVEMRTVRGRLVGHGCAPQGELTAPGGVAGHRERGRSEEKGHRHGGSSAYGQTVVPSPKGSHPLGDQPREAHQGKVEVPIGEGMGQGHNAAHRQPGHCHPDERRRSPWGPTPRPPPERHPADHQSESRGRKRVGHRMNRLNPPNGAQAHRRYKQAGGSKEHRRGRGGGHPRAPIQVAKGLGRAGHGPEPHTQVGKSDDREDSESHSPAPVPGHERPSVDNHIEDPCEGRQHDGVLLGEARGRVEQGRQGESRRRGAFLLRAGPIGHQTRHDEEGRQEVVAERHGIDHRRSHRVDGEDESTHQGHPRRGPPGRQKENHQGGRHGVEHDVGQVVANGPFAPKRVVDEVGEGRYGPPGLLLGPTEVLAARQSGKVA